LKEYYNGNVSPTWQLHDDNFLITRIRETFYLRFR